MSLSSPMKPLSSEPLRERLVDLANGSGQAARAGTLLGQLGEPPLLSDAALARIEGRLLSAVPAGGAAATSLLRWLGIGVTIAAVSTGTYLVASRSSSQKRAPAEILHPIAAPTTTSRPAVYTRVVATNTAPDSQLEDEPAPAALRRADGPRGGRNDRSRRAVPTVTPPAAPTGAAPVAVEESSLLVESKLLGQALHQLHQEHDGQAALGSLSTYESRFPRGLLGEEAQAAKVDALLSLSRRGEALELLERVTFTRLARGGELRAVRGELRAANGRCREATSDFAWAINHQPTTGTTERALYGRAACKQTLHDSEGARADFNEYLERFPSGKFAAAAHAALATLRERPEK